MESHAGSVGKIEISWMTMRPGNKLPAIDVASILNTLAEFSFLISELAIFLYQVLKRAKTRYVNSGHSTQTII